MKQGVKYLLHIRKNNTIYSYVYIQHIPEYIWDCIIKKMYMINMKSNSKSIKSKPFFHLFPFCFLQEYNPDLVHNISKKEKSKKGNDVVMLTHVTTAGDHAVDRGR